MSETATTTTTTKPGSEWTKVPKEETTHKTMTPKPAATGLKLNPESPVFVPSTTPPVMPPMNPLSPIHDTEDDAVAQGQEYDVGQEYDEYMQYGDPAATAAAYMYGYGLSPSMSPDGSPLYDGSMTSPLSSPYDNSPNQQPMNMETQIKSIIQQVEFYFSDSNLYKDGYLRNMIAKDAEGWVEISTISGFKRIKRVTSDLPLIVCALRQSSKLVVDEGGVRVRRITQLPPRNSKAEQRRTVYVSNLPSNTTIDSIRALFEIFGEVAHVRILKPSDDMYEQPVVVRKSRADSSSEWRSPKAEPTEAPKIGDLPPIDDALTPSSEENKNNANDTTTKENGIVNNDNDSAAATTDSMTKKNGGDDGSNNNSNSGSGSGDEEKKPDSATADDGVPKQAFVEFTKQISTKNCFSKLKSDPDLLGAVKVIAQAKHMNKLKMERRKSQTPQQKPRGEGDVAVRKKKVFKRDVMNWRLDSADPNENEKQYKQLKLKDKTKTAATTDDNDDTTSHVPERSISFSKKPIKFSANKRNSAILKVRMAKGPSGPGFLPGRGRPEIQKSN